MHHSIYVVCIIGLLRATCADAVVGTERKITNKNQQVDDSRRLLEWVKFKVGDEEYMVKRGEEFTLVEGDRFTLLDAGLVDPALKATKLNLVGFTPKAPSSVGDDRGLEVSSRLDLQKPWSIDGKGELYRVKVNNGNLLAGEVFVRIISPELRYAEIKVNGEERTVREGSLLKVNKKDEVSVTKVVTNIEKDRERVDFQIVPSATAPDLAGVKFYEMRFLREGKVFARIPMQVEGT